MNPEQARHRGRLRRLVLLLGLLLPASCGSDHAGRAGDGGASASWAPAEPPPESALTVESNAGTYWVACIPHGEYVVDGAVPLNDEFDVEVRVYDAETRSKRPLGVEVFVDGRMPIHGHGMRVEPEHEVSESGVVDARGLIWHMTGPWELHVDIRRGALTERAQFEIVLE